MSVMKKWGALVVLYYFIALTVLAGPVSLIYSNAYPYDNIIKKFYGVYGRPEWWAIITIMCIGQALLLFVPIQITERKLKSKRPLLVPVITAAFMTTVLLSTLAIFITMTIIETEGFISGPLLDGLDLWNGYQWTALILLAWLFWSVFFYKATRTLEPESLMRRLTSWMLKGSILELLIAVPCHIFVRRREDCCAPIATFWGIAAGIAIMLFSFGPGVFFLFADRLKRIKPDR